MTYASVQFYNYMPFVCTGQYNQVLGAEKTNKTGAMTKVLTVYKKSRELWATQSVLAQYTYLLGAEIAQECPLPSPKGLRTQLSHLGTAPATRCF